MIKQQIINKLHETEVAHNVKIPLAIESGSRGWGFASPDSDYDCRFIYVPSKEYYLSIQNRRDVIEYDVDAVFDINGWELAKAIQHIIKSNAVILEWLSCQEIYLRHEEVASKLERLAKKFFNPIHVTHHYLALARKKLDEIEGNERALLKAYFYVLRPLANVRYIEKFGVMSPMEYHKTLSAIDLDDEVCAEIGRLLEIKKSAVEAELIEHNEILVSYFKREIDYYTARVKEMKFEPIRDLEFADEVFREILELMWDNG